MINVQVLKNLEQKCKNKMHKITTTILLYLHLKVTAYLKSFDVTFFGMRFLRNLFCSGALPN